MATSLAGLLDTSSRTARDHTHTSLEDRHAAFGHLGRALDNLVADGLDHQIGSYRDRFATELARACHAAAVATPRATRGRIAELAAATADTTAILRAEFTHASRWATTLAVTDTIRHIAAGCEPAANPIAPLAVLNRATALVLKTGAVEPPAGADRIILDRPIPQTAETGRRSPPDVIDESIATLIHQTRPGTNLSVAQVLAVTTIAESLCSHTTAADANTRPHLHDAAAGWQAARLALQRFHDGDRSQRLGQPRLITSAIDLAHAIEQHPPSPGNDAVSDSLHSALHRLPVLADHLDQAVQRWRATGQVCAYATDLYRRDERATELLAGYRITGTVTVDMRDLVPARRAIRSAGLLSARAADQFADMVRVTSGSPDIRHSVAAHHEAFASPDVEHRANLAATRAYRTISQSRPQAVRR